MRMCRHTRHQGCCASSLDEGSNEGAKKADLVAELADAIKAEDYAAAAKIRDALK